MQTSQTLTVTVTDKLGLLSPPGAAGGTITGAGTAKLTLAGTLAQVDADLAALSYYAAKVGSDTITVAAKDSAGGVAVSKTIAVTVSATGAAAIGPTQPDQFAQALAAFGPGPAAPHAAEFARLALNASLLAAPGAGSVWR